MILYFLLTFGFTYFYTAFTFKPDETAEQPARTAGSSRHPSGPADGRLPGQGRDPDHDRRRAVPGHRRDRPSIVGVLVPSLTGIALGGTGL